MEIGKVYKSHVDSNLFRTPIYVGTINVLMLNVVQDNSATLEFTVKDHGEAGGGDFHVLVNEFTTKWLPVENIDVTDQVNAIMSPLYS